MLLKGKRKQMVSCGILAVLLLCFIGIGLQINSVHEQWGSYREISVEECTLNGYEYKDGVFHNTIGDANIQLPEINQKISAVTVVFQEPVPQALNICVYYSQENHGYSEEYTGITTVSANATETFILVDALVEDIRIDIGTQAGETFALDSIVINDPALKNVHYFEAVLEWLIPVVCIVAILAFIGYGWKNEKMVLVMVLIFGMFYCIVMTPFSPPDEHYHYHSSYRLSNYLLLQLNHLGEGDASHFNYQNLTGHLNSSQSYLQVVKTFTSPEKLQGDIPIPFPGEIGYFMQYLPQAIGVAIGRILPLNFIGIFYLGRICNLLFYAACVYWAVKKAVRFKPILAMVALLPMSLHQAASYSYDAFIIGIALCLTAYFINAIYEKGPLDKKNYFTIMVLGAILAPAKVVYAAILLMAFLIPQARFGSRKEWIKKILFLFVAAGATIAIFKLTAMANWVGSSSEGSLNWEGQQNYSVQFIFSHPLSAVKIFLNTFSVKGQFYYTTCIGGLLSGLSLPIPSYIVSIFALLLILSIPEPNDYPLVTTRVQRLVYFLGFAVAVLLIMLSMFIGWTSVSRNAIEGVQGRYFLPVLPLLLMCLSNRTIVLKRDISKYLLIVAAILQSLILTYVLHYTIG